MFTFYGLAIVIASYILRIFVQLNFIATAWEKLFIDIMITICSHLSTIGESKYTFMLVCEFRVTSFSY